jgi:hypothetical protein
MMEEKNKNTRENLTTNQKIWIGWFLFFCIYTLVFLVSYLMVENLLFSSDFFIAYPSLLTFSFVAVLIYTVQRMLNREIAVEKERNKELEAAYDDRPRNKFETFLVCYSVFLVIFAIFNFIVVNSLLTVIFVFVSFIA